MYYFRFGQIQEEQSVGYCNSSHLDISPGDLFQSQGDFFLCLGEEISWVERYCARFSLIETENKIAICKHKTILFIHWMVYNRFSSYKKVVPLFLGELELLLKYRKKKTTQNNKQEKKQNLTIFPTLLSLYEHTKHLDTENKDNIFLSGQTTPIQRAKAYESIQSGQAVSIFATHSQVFWDYNRLMKIQIIDKDSPFYRTYQEPRYDINIIANYLQQQHILLHK